MKVFWSYAKRDDAKPCHVTQLRKQFEIVLGQCLGKDIKLFQDTTDLKWGSDWRKTLKLEVKSSDVFVCILSPSFFNSKICIQEIIWAIESDVAIHPILYRACPNKLQSSFSEDSEPLAKELNEKSIQIGKFQYADFTKFRNLPKDSI